MRHVAFSWVFILSSSLSFGASTPPGQSPAAEAQRALCEALAEGSPLSGDEFDRVLLDFVQALPVNPKEQRISTKDRVAMMEIFSNQDQSRVLEFAGRIPYILKRQGLIVEGKLQNPLRDLVEIFAFTLQRLEDPSRAIEAVVAGLMLIEKQDHANFNPATTPRSIAVRASEAPGASEILWEANLQRIRPIAMVAWKAVEKLILHEKARRYALRDQRLPGFDQWPRGERPGNLPVYTRPAQRTTASDFVGAGVDAFMDPWIWVPGDIVDLLDVILTTPASHAPENNGLEAAAEAVDGMGAALENVDLSDSDFLSSLSEGAMPLLEGAWDGISAAGGLLVDAGGAVLGFFAEVLGGLGD